jgi:hypothetical protein
VDYISYICITNNNNKTIIMKSLLAVAAIALTMASCGQGSKANAEGVATDSTAVDTTAVAVDSTTAQIPADTTSTK